MIGEPGRIARAAIAAQVRTKHVVVRAQQQGHQVPNGRGLGVAIQQQQHRLVSSSVVVRKESYHVASDPFLDKSKNHFTLLIPRTCNAELDLGEWGP